MKRIRGSLSHECMIPKKAHAGRKQGEGKPLTRVRFKIRSRHEWECAGKETRPLLAFVYTAACTSVVYGQKRIRQSPG